MNKRQRKKAARPIRWGFSGRYITGAAYDQRTRLLTITCSRNKPHTPPDLANIFKSAGPQNVEVKDGVAVVRPNERPTP